MVCSLRLIQRVVCESGRVCVCVTEVQCAVPHRWAQVCSLRLIQHV